MLPKAPYVLTRYSGSNELFIRCVGENRFTIGLTLNAATIEKSAYTVTLRLLDGGRPSASPRSRARYFAGHKRSSASSSKHAIAIVTVSQLSHDKLPLTMSKT